MIPKIVGQQENSLLLNKWIHLLARLCGYWSFHIDFNQLKSPNAVQITTIDWIRAVIAIAVYLICICIQLISLDFLLQLNYSLMEVLLDLTTSICSQLIFIVTTIMNLIQRNTLRNVLLTFYNFDEAVRFR